ncbi:MAG: DUF389 domain-containing protein [Bacteroidaceae bacterium]|nr:DUF389 domain-containing protein [Bacteroidaceae bacterium]
MYKEIKEELKKLFNLQADAAPESEVVKGIHAGIDFSGAKLWILILAIFTASLGLNTNSTAVIIGAMLISPLMGPIIGMGLSVGMNDFETFKRALRSYIIATVFSIFTAIVYWLITPVAETQSELLARTSPTIYDVFIALVGGLAGIIALTSAGQRTGNVIPGVAIATALMPPLCTTGFGLATGQFAYALGAFYLYVINTIFISVATFIGVRIMHFHPKVFVDKAREKRVRNIITGIVILTMIPASILTYHMVVESVWRERASSFVNNELNWDGTQVVAKEFDYAADEISVVTLGRVLSHEDSVLAVKRLSDYMLSDTKLTIVQGANGVDMGKIRSMIGARDQQKTQMVVQLEQEVSALKSRLQPYESADEVTRALGDEMRALFPEVDRVSVSRARAVSVTDSLASACSLTCVFLRLNQPLTGSAETRLQSWLKTRVEADSLEVVMQLERR